VSTTFNPRTTGGEQASDRSTAPGVKHRPAWIVFIVLGALVCLGMGLWQLARYQEVSGTVQNLGYTFMWPFLAGFLVYAYFKYIRMEADEAAGLHDPANRGRAPGGLPDETGDDEAGTQRGPGRASAHARGRGRAGGPAMTEIPADILPTRRPTAPPAVEDEGLRAYNSYLAELAHRDRAAGDRSQENPRR